MNIKVGDLVMIKKPKPCCGKGTLGYVFVVDRIGRFPGACDDCGYWSTGLAAAFGGKDAVDVSRLIKIDPPAIDEDTEANRQLADSTPA